MNEKKDKFTNRITRWLPQHGIPEPSQYGVVDGWAWVAAEKRHLAEQGIATHIKINKDGEIALFREG